MASATIKLTSYHMGDVTEADFDAWAAYVAARIDKETGLDVTVEQYRFGEGFEDDISEDGDDRETIREAIQSLWEAFCADDSAWPQSADAAAIDLRTIETDAADVDIADHVLTEERADSAAALDRVRNMSMEEYDALSDDDRAKLDEQGEMNRAAHNAEERKKDAADEAAGTGRFERNEISGLTFDGWLESASGTEGASQDFLRATWRAGYGPHERVVYDTDDRGRPVPRPKRA